MGSVSDILATIEAVEIGRQGKAGGKVDAALGAAERAHASMFLGRIAEARALYLAPRGEKLPTQGDRNWEAVLLGDFPRLRAAGLSNPLMQAIEQAFTPAK